MLVIADSGSTKTNWAIISESKISYVNTIGLNPYFTTVEVALNEINKSISDDICQTAKQVFFYGAGCALSEKIELIKIILSQVFKNATIVVESDILGASRALLGNNPGICSILGTGANTCYFNGKKITHSTPSLGFILGDEGSGAYMGKNFLKAILYNEFSENITNKFYNELNLDLKQILHNVYKEAFPNRFLASFTKFIHKNSSNPEIQFFIENCFDKYFENHPLKLPEIKLSSVNLCGSVAYYFEEWIRKSAKKHQVEVGKIIQAPINDLILFHQNSF